jgi:hypothetical protein
MVAASDMGASSRPRRRAKPDLIAGFFAGDIQDAGAGAGQGGRRLQQERGFADAGITADQDGRGRDKTAAEYAVKLADLGQ